MKSKLGHYDIVGELGRGGMGVVLKGFEAALNRHVAIKVLSEALAHDPSVVERFFREARAMAALNDPHIIQVYFIGEDEGQPFFVMEFVEGETLSALLKREHRLTTERSREILLQAASGLATAHDKGVIHRDIKPGNLMLNLRGMVKVADFGIALATKDLSKKLTSTGEFVGTPGYLSPEVCLGKIVDERSDIFSLGIVFFEMLTGKIPFTDESPLGLMLEVVRAEVPDVRQLNGEVDDATYNILQRMIAKEPSERFADCHELVEALKSAGTTSSTVSSRRSALPALAAAATAAYVSQSALAQPPPTLHPSAAAQHPSQPSLQTALLDSRSPPTVPRFASNSPMMVSAQQPALKTQASPRRAPVLALTAMAAALLALIGGAAFGFSNGWFGGGATPPPATASVAAAQPFSSSASSAGVAAVALTAAATANAEPTSEPMSEPSTAPANPGTTVDPANATLSAAIDPATSATDASAAVNAQAAALEAQVRALKEDMARLQQASIASNTSTASVPPPAPPGPMAERAKTVLDRRTALRETRPTINAGPPRVFVMAAGDRTIAEPAEQAIESALINAGISIADESFIGNVSSVLRSGGGDLPGKIAAAVGARPKDILILVRAVPQGSQNISFYGQNSTLSTANLTVQGFLLGEKRPAGGASTVRVNFTALNAAQQAEIAVQELLPRLVDTVKRARG